MINTFAATAAAFELNCASLTLATVSVKLGTVLPGADDSAEAAPTAVKIQVGNRHGYRFGKRINDTIVRAYAEEVHGARFSYENVTFDGHYWWGDIIDAKTGQRADHLRMDYHINYERLPEFVAKAA